MSVSAKSVLTARHSDRLLDVMSAFDEVAIIMHDNPDPDAIASGWAVACLLEAKLGCAARILGGGAIVRAENRHMVDLLQPPITLVDSLDLDEQTATILVDCGPDATNQMLGRFGLRPVAVIDHHAGTPPSGDVPFVDVRPEAAACASIAGSYLREQGVPLGFKLATALVYAVRTETMGGETSHSSLDRTMLPWLMEQADPELLAEIESAPLPRAYFGDLVLALQKTFVYEDAAICFLPQAQGPEIVGEVADLLIRCSEVTRVLCAALVGRDLVLSARTSNDDHAAQLLRRTIEGLGSAGGHAHRAGGKIHDAGCGDRMGDDLGAELRRRWLAACNIARRRGTRLVAKHNIVENL